MHSLFGTGSMPGIAASTRLTWVLGSAPNAVAAPEKSFDLVAVIWAWTSRPTTTSHSPVWPLMRKGAPASAMENTVRAELVEALPFLSIARTRTALRQAQGERWNGIYAHHHFSGLAVNRARSSIARPAF